MKTTPMITAGMALLFLGVGCHKQQAKVEDAKANPAATPATGDEGVRKGLPEAGGERLATAYFDFNQAVLRHDARDTLKKDAQLLKQNPDVTIRVEGHCDERGSTQYNLALGERRAQAAKKYLVNLGVSPARVDTVSFGKERPADSGHDESAWSHNRRVEMAVTGNAGARVSSSY